MEFLHEYNACIRYMVLPNRVNAFTLYDDENEFYNIYVNEKLDNYEKRKAILHELEHIKKGHFKSSCEQDMNEIEWGMSS